MKDKGNSREGSGLTSSRTTGRKNGKRVDTLRILSTYGCLHRPCDFS